MARSDAIIATYQMIHMAQSPRIKPTAVGSTPGTVGAKHGEIGTCAIGLDENPGSVTFQQPERNSIAPLGWASKIVNGVTACRHALLIHNLGVPRQVIYSALETFRRTEGLCAPRSRCLWRSCAADPDPSV